MSERSVRILLVIVSTLVTIAVMAAAWEAYRRMEYAKWKEGFARHAWLEKLTIPSAAEGLLWEYRPHGEIREIRTNGFGFRDTDFATPDKPERTYRYVFIGDSVTLGMGVDLEDTFVKKFEKLANGQSRESERIQALNFGIDGYNTVQVRALLASKVPPFQPDHVVYVLCPNDFDFYASSGHKALYFDPPRFFVLRDLETRLRKLAGIGYHRFMFLKNKTRVRQEILEMEALARSLNSRFSILIMPVFPPDEDDFDDYDEVYIHEFIGNIFKDRPLIVWDTLEMFRARHQPPATFAHDVWHPNALGHALVAEFVLNKVRALDAHAD